MKTGNLQLTKSFGTDRLAGLLAGCLSIAAGPSALGASAFMVDPSQSQVSLSGSVLGRPFEAQGSGSLTAQYGGTLLAEVDGQSIRFPGQSQVVAMDTGSWEPLSDGMSGSAPANYGAEASELFAAGVAAVRNVQVDVTSGALPVVDGKFDTRGITVAIPAGAPSSIGYRVEGAIDASGAVPLNGQSATGQSAQASLTTVGSIQVLTIPINYQFFFSLLSTDDTTLTLTGQLVAVRNL